MSVDLVEKPSPSTTTPSSQAAALTVKPLTPILGAEVGGIDLRQELDAQTAARVREALLAHKVLVFRDQPLTDDEQIRFSRIFGKVTPAHPITNGLPDQPAIMQNVKSVMTSRVNELDAIARQQLRANSKGRRLRGWHTDITFVANPTSVTILRGLEIPDGAGDTAWVDLEALYAALSPAFQQLVDGLTAVHGRDDARIGYTPLPRDDGRTTGPFLSEHALVRIHPETGRKSLFVNPVFLKYIPDLTDAEGAALLDYLFEEQAGRIDLQVRVQWRTNDIVVWDNRNTSHWGPLDEIHFAAERIVRRTTVDPEYTTGPTGFRSRQIVGEPFYTLD
ncbi:TauD/TfdA dioxygenase family protein [Novosphingobium sp.]|uniref:TauD/TfdA dioxygenase family protein n=1 Tax=Novosphingobium sp. TaxID=1874826 RepID=UPI0038B86F95